MISCYLVNNKFILKNRLSFYKVCIMPLLLTNSIFSFFNQKCLEVPSIFHLSNFFVPHDFKRFTEHPVRLLQEK